MLGVLFTVSNIHGSFETKGLIKDHMDKQFKMAQSTVCSHNYWKTFTYLLNYNNLIFASLLVVLLWFNYTHRISVIESNALTTVVPWYQPVLGNFFVWINFPQINIQGKRLRSFLLSKIKCTQNCILNLFPDFQFCVLNWANN